MKKIIRRKFLQNLALSASATGILAACSAEKEKEGKNRFDETFTWTASTTWSPHFPILGEGMDLFAEQVKIMSAGRLEIKVYGAGEIIPAFELFDAVSQGAIQVGHGASYYWTGKIPSSAFFCTIPFGLNPQQMNAWLYSAGGLKMWEEVYAKHNLIPFPCGNTGVQMGGWFNKEINSLSDFKGLKIRMPGFGGKVATQIGGSALQIAGSEIYTNLERGVIDAAEWIGPYHDYLMGFHKIAKYYYYPGWHETGPTLELIINKIAFEKLPTDLQEIVRTASYRSNLWMLSEFEAKNAEYLVKMLEEKQIQIKKYPDDVLLALKKASENILTDLIAKDEMSKKVYEHLLAFKKRLLAWNAISENAILPYL